MTPLIPFREHHLVQLLHLYEDQDRPLDLVVNAYFREHKSLGSKDRKAIAEAVYSISRWRGLLDALSPQPPSWQKRIDAYATFDPSQHLDRADLPPHVRYSCPEELYQLLVEDYGDDEARRLCLVTNTPAPTTIRVNTLKIDSEGLLRKWQGVYTVSPCSQAPNGIVLGERHNLFSSQEYSAGLFEMQDEASQLVAELVDAKPGQQVMDFCSGSGGKALAFAPKMKGKGQIFLHDIRAHILIEARKRLRRAGIQNAQVINPESPALKKLKRNMDWVLVDAPCSGTGTLRRNPDMKWTIDREAINRLVGTQRLVFEQALSYLKPNGHIVYATCSILKKENQSQVEHFCRTYGLQVEGQPFQTLPSEGGMDGFFGAVMRKNH